MKFWILVLGIGLVALSFSSELNSYSMGGHGHYWKDVAATQARWVRMWAGDGGALWGEIQPTSLDSFKWDAQDQWIREADSAGFQIMLTIRTGGDSVFGSIYTCRWVDTTYEAELGQQKNYPNASYPPKHYQDWYNFVCAVVKRYDGTTPDPKKIGKNLPRVLYYETQAENDYGYWYGTKEEYYDQFLPTFYQAVHAANPAAVVIGASLTGPGIMWGAIKKMTGEGISHDSIAGFYNRNMRYTTLGPINWTWIQNQLATSNIQREINFVEYSYRDGTIFDKRGFHQYENWETLPEIIAYERSMMEKNGYLKELWATELGHIDKRVLLNIDGVPQPEAAARTFKKVVLALADSVEWQCYPPMMSGSITLGFLPLYLWMGLTLEAREAEGSFVLIAGKINETTGYQINRQESTSRFHFFYFKSTILSNRTLVAAWADSGKPDTVRIDLPEGLSRITQYDYKGDSISLAPTDSLTLVLSFLPVLVEWEGKTGAGEPGGRTAEFIRIQGKEIYYSMKASGLISLRLFDACGRRRAVLVNERQAMGIHRVSLPADLTSGVYFLNFDINQCHFSKKIVVAK